MNTILGGSFTSRINMNLREDKGWSYGSGSILLDAKGQRPFIVFAFIQSDKTKESMQEVYKELTGILSTNPPTEDELNKVKLNLTLSLPGSWETNGEVQQALSEMVRFNYADDYWNTYAGKVKGLSLGQIGSAAEKVLRPENVAWVVVGDRESIAAGLNELGYEVIEIDVDGNVLNQ